MESFRVSVSALPRRTRGTIGSPSAPAMTIGKDRLSRRGRKGQAGWS